MTDMRRWYQALLIGCVVLCCWSGPATSDAAEGRIYRVHGQVVAVNATDLPNLIVVRTPVTSRSDMTVGAAVTAQTKIVRAGKRVALQSIRAGEMVWLTYVKRRDGVVAQVIQLRA